MKKLSIIIIAVLALLVCCKKTPEVNIKYVDVEREVLTIGQTTANIQCDYEYIATLKSAKLYYGIGEATSYVEMRVVQSSLYAELSGLNSGTSYKYYYEFTNGFNLMQSETKMLVTEISSSVVLPTVITANVTEITTNSAVSGGEATNDGGGNVIEKGICWSTTQYPTINDNCMSHGSGAGSYVTNLNGLESNTTYYVRAYATNESGTAYGLEKTFRTLSTGSDAPTGAINGLFTINSNGYQIYFSQGNLQYQASTNTWRFAEHQWDYVGGQEYGTVYANGIKCDNSYISSTYDGWIDLFGWGTSGYNHGAICYQPWSSTGWPHTDYSVYGEYFYNLYDQTGQADWGYNAISNGSMAENQWHALKSSEWDYVINARNTASGIRYAKASLNIDFSINGLIILPDNWDESYYTLVSPNTPNVDYYSNSISQTDWVNIFEVHGAVFLPAAGLRFENDIQNMGMRASYWSSSRIVNDEVEYRKWAHTFTFATEDVFATDGTERGNGLSVRLVQSTNK